MLPRADIVGTRPVASVEATRPIIPTGDAHQELSQRLNRIALGSFLEGEILSRLHDGTFVVKVADTAVRMNLPAGAQVGKTVDLTLVATQPRPTFLLNTQAPDNSTALSNAGRLIDWIIHTAKAAGAPAALAGKAPLVPSPDADAGQIAASMKDSLEFSGLFYESHLEHWASGERPLATMLREPQAKNGSQQLLEAALKAAQGRVPQSDGEHLARLIANLAQGGAPQSDGEHLTRLLANLASQPDAARALMSALHATHQRDPGLPPEAAAEPAQLAQNPLQPDAESAPESSADMQRTDASPQAMKNAVNVATGQPPIDSDIIAPQKTMSSDSVNMINLQLNALEQHRIAWHGELWPGQEIEWEVSEDTPQGAHEEMQERAWQSVIRFELPTLGKVSATVRLTGERVQIQVRAASDDTAMLLRANGDALSTALAAAGSPLEQFSVKRDAEG